MKEPKCTPIDGSDHQGHAIETCYECGTDWPCKTWRRWTKSKDYRIAQLEEGLKYQRERTARLDSQVSELTRTVRDDSNILHNGIFRAMRDLGRHGRMGDLTLDWTGDELDVSDFMSPRTSLSLPAELTVTYADVDGRTWTNGRDG